MRVIADIETNRLVNPDKLWYIVCRDIDKPEDVYIFERPDTDETVKQEFLKFARGVTLWVGHYFLSFDLPFINSFLRSNVINPRDVLDTVVLSRLLNYKKKGGHSLENWGEYLGEKKKHADLTAEDFLNNTPEVLERCVVDTLVTLKLYNYFSKYLEREDLQQSIKLEHDIAHICRDIKNNGFPFDYSKAVTLRDELTLLLSSLDKELQKGFPAKEVVKSTVTVRGNKNGTIHSTDLKRLLAVGYESTEIEVGKTYEIKVLEEFDPGSNKQVIDRLNEAGWKPTEKTKGHEEFSKPYRNRRPSETGGNFGVHSRNSKGIDRRQSVRDGGDGTREARHARYSTYGWKLSEDNLKTLPETAPEVAKRLTERLVLASRISHLTELIELCKLDPDGVYRIHGEFHGIGAWTHRMSTSRPNMQNIPVPQGVDTELGKLTDYINRQFREMWYAPSGHVLIGTDAAGIQMRIFAHYVNDDKLIKALVEGKSEDGTDIHTVHQKALGDVCKTRRNSKTFIYAWLLGAGNGKVAEILGCSREEARDAIERFLAFYPGLLDLKRNRIPNDAAIGYFEGIDGRLVVSPDEYLMLSGYLQNGEAVVMKRGCRQWRNECYKRKLPFWQVNFVHDEWQTLTIDDNDLREEIALLQRQSIIDQGDQLNLNCPLDAESVFGYNWMETH